MRIEFVSMAFMLWATVAMAQVNAVVTNGETPFAEGVLKDYVIQVSGRAICSHPFAIGRYISCKDHVRAAGMVWHVPSDQQVWVDTNGVLGAMIVMDENGNEACHDPVVWNKFRGSLSYIVCGD